MELTETLYIEDPDKRLMEIHDISKTMIHRSQSDTITKYPADGIPTNCAAG